MDINSGKIYIVSTPIGNLKDITFRAIEVLKEVDIIAAEDTRRTRELLNHFDIKTKVTSYHEHSSYEKAEEIINKIKDNANVAIVTDAGTPLISDPGNRLVKLAIENNIEVIAVPGACAGINALVVSGLDASSFVFVGFLSDNKKIREQQLDSLKLEMRTMIFYVSPHNLLKDLKLLSDAFGKERLASISREMTKVYEETIRGSLNYILNYFNSKEIRGEFVLIVSGINKEKVKESEKKAWQDLSIKEHYDKYLLDGLTDKEAIKKVAKDRDIDRREVYKELKVK
ncbi:MAG: 16S rRNA (cytidine(1402)-2'-O)-methyltransferase [Lachnospiraceae bacterium]|nr:16S rRNA (cytidine(1402)-2'-O)-methyltransferase [Lachnospiraceae bacterium]